MTADDDEVDDIPVRVIRRYANRKLYDTVERAFTTLGALEDLVRDGVDVKVVDHTTGEDLTEVVLMRALGSVVRASGAGVSAVLGSLLRAPGGLAGAASGPARSRRKERPADDEAQADEVRQLREQVSELTSLVERLLADRGDGGSTDA